jgi:hypothetical protein
MQSTEWRGGGAAFTGGAVTQKCTGGGGGGGERGRDGLRATYDTQADLARKTRR